MLFNAESNNRNFAEKYYDTWFKLIEYSHYSRNQRKKKATLGVDELSKTNHIKTKYFAVWRKYILKKRKQQHSIQLAGAHTKPSNLSSVMYSSNENLSKSNNFSLGGEFSYELNIKWIRYCLFCQRFLFFILFICILIDF